MKKQWLEWIKAFAIAAILAVVVRVFLLAPVVVEGPSMLNTLHSDDHLIVSKINYTLGNPERFDIVVFHATERKDYIKRIIGLPGDTVRYSNDQLYINGEAFEEPYLEELKKELPEGEELTRDFSMDQLPGSNEEVPEGELLVLGDNRNNSTDSRMLGTIPKEQVVGEAVFLYWPLNRIKFMN
ncbi:S26 family signal peptidase [Halobacillus halophilus]|uniref:Signal peptidase I n=1 Tax=Halobacillus halophilus (strain ATCC 35676 / DSM 2266 / JCM 20832 / KCTC 3685 / LMG 17431 / NBRC 102448 / NCIMB 2269) TaxID=866895 RepID=I0JMJ3_HALH3|nr:signal peptidase I [Halobacillus halophilus]ASF39445.1 S26 family signal peptidase [Halobacillus halophilus]CCG45363.1 signal peptidase I [Halobacillus halophilus DSM 2266]